MKFVEDGVLNEYVEQDDKLIVKRSMTNLEALFARNKAMADIAPSMRGEAATRYVGSIDAITAEQWAKECGAAIGTQEFALYCQRKLMDSDNSKFLVKGF